MPTRREARTSVLPEGQNLGAGGIQFRRGYPIRPEGSQTRRRVWDMQTEFYLGKNFL